VGGREVESGGGKARVGEVRVGEVRVRRETQKSGGANTTPRGRAVRIGAPVQLSKKMDSLIFFMQFSCQL